jgi:hypothetical protein
MQPILPFWFKQRQCNAEPVGTNQLKLTGPNLGEAYIRIGLDEAKKLWWAALRLSPDGDDLHTTPTELPGPKEAWEAAFELYRNQVIV